MTAGPPFPVPRTPSRQRRFGALMIVVALLAGATSGAVVSALMSSDSPADQVATTVATTVPPSSSALTTIPVVTVFAGNYPDVPAIVADVRKSVVSIDVTVTSFDPRGRPITGTASGTGIVISANGLIATNAHVVANAQQITVTLPDGTSAAGQLIGSRTAEDLAVVQVGKTGLVPATFGKSSALRVGDLVVAVGNALALNGGPTASLGIVSALDRTITTSDGSSYSHLLQTDAAINSGDSGGPLVNAAGQVVGINSAAALTAENIGFAISVDVALPILTAIYNG